LAVDRSRVRRHAILAVGSKLRRQDGGPFWRLRMAATVSDAEMQSAFPHLRCGAKSPDTIAAYSSNYRKRIIYKKILAKIGQTDRRCDILYTSS
jgi:hypothetical protein